MKFNPISIVKSTGRLRHPPERRGAARLRRFQLVKISPSLAKFKNHMHISWGFNIPNLHGIAFCSENIEKIQKTSDSNMSKLVDAKPVDANRIHLQ